MRFSLLGEGHRPPKRRFVTVRVTDMPKCAIRRSRHRIAAATDWMTQGHARGATPHVGEGLDANVPQVDQFEIAA
jgi:hypothetical protein